MSARPSRTHVKAPTSAMLEERSTSSMTSAFTLTGRLHARVFGSHRKFGAHGMREPRAPAALQTWKPNPSEAHAVVPGLHWQVPAIEHISVAWHVPQE